MLVEGPLNNLKQSMVQFPKPRKFTDRRYLALGPALNNPDAPVVDRATNLEGLYFPFLLYKNGCTQIIL